MPDGVQVASEKSRRRFEKFVKPILERELGATILPIEKENNNTLLGLDMFSGMDWIVKTRDGLNGLASRIQDDEELKRNNPDKYRPYRTFTVRVARASGVPTEIDKLNKAISSNKYLYPYWTSQAYTNGDDRLNRLAIVQTLDLYEIVQTNTLPIIHTGDNQFGQADFKPVDWYLFRKNKKFIYIYENPVATPSKFDFDATFHWPDWPMNGTSTWSIDLYKYWIKENMGTREQIARYRTIVELRNG